MMSHGKVFLIWVWVNVGILMVLSTLTFVESIAGFHHMNDHQMYIISIGLVMDPIVIETIIRHFDDVI